MESTSHMSTKLRRPHSKGILICFWIFTALFCLEMSFTAYYELMILPQAAQAFTRLGFPASYFRVAQPVHTTLRAANTARLRPQHLPLLSYQPRRNVIVIVAPVSTVGRQDDKWRPSALYIRF